jgi:hypothetical protein
MNATTISIPLELPSVERMEELYREALTAAAKARVNWLDSSEAAQYVGWGRSTFFRRRREFGLPVSEINGTKMYYRPDLDALLLSHMSAPEGAKVIEFPSIMKRDDLRKEQALATAV